jgi:hypothetical protein
MKGSRLVWKSPRMAARAVVAAIVSVVFAAAASNAAVTGTATLIKDPSIGLPFAAPDSALGAPWVSYLLTIQATAGERIQAIDAHIKGSLHQNWTGVDCSGGGFCGGTFNSTNETNGDSHALAPPEALLLDFGGEDNSFMGSPFSDPLVDAYGVGTYLRGVWTFQGINGWRSQAKVAYLVIPRGAERTLDIRIQVGDPTGEVIADLRARSFFVPEPSTAILAGTLVLGASFIRPRRGSPLRLADH